MIRAGLLIGVLLATTACTRPASAPARDAPDPRPPDGISISGEARIGIVTGG